ncbi:pyruvate dehydrogenase E2 component (dihydrolipoamide acetyltransferase) [Planctomycetaceae bacterium]|nr:pyruvate dehydrogenase E2 component (dihydrolipoamide acetyltransferase) [Planctomycetaceae bacterium]
MAEPIMMPNLGAGMEEGTLINWLKQVGDTVSDGDVIAEVDADKATVEVPVEISGTILSLEGEPGATLKVGSVIGYVGQAGENAPAGEAKPAASSPPPPTPAEQPAAQGNGAASAQKSGNGAPPAAQTAAPKEPAEAEADGDSDYPAGVKASPVARKIAQDKGIDLSRVQGTGPGGRIVKADVENYKPAAAPAPAAAQAGAPGAIPAPSYGPLPSGPDVEVIETSKLRSRIAARMTESKQQIPHFYVTTEIDVEAMLALRKQLNEGLDDAQKISVNDMVIKATALTLRQFPNLNSHYYGDQTVRHKRIHIGIAVALPQGGLINVVAKDADKVSLGTLAVTNKEMIARVIEGKLKPDDISGSTFTVSNMGMYDVEHFIAVINPPEAGILAIGSAMKVPVVKPDGTVGVGNHMKVTISVDHRVSDGAEGAKYLQAFKKLIETPMQLLL